MNARHRIDTLGGGVSSLVDRVPEADIATCLQLLAVTAVDVTDLGDDLIVRDVLSQWRHHGKVSGSARLHLESMRHQTDHDGFAHRRRGDVDAHRASFFRARALSCLTYGLDGHTSPRSALREAAYEAAIAVQGSGAVVAILSDFIEGSLRL